MRGKERKERKRWFKKGEWRIKKRDKKLRKEGGRTEMEEMRWRGSKGKKVRGSDKEMKRKHNEEVREERNEEMEKKIRR